MTPEQFSKLKTGDLVCPKHGTHGYVVLANYGNYVIAVRHVHMTNPQEWDLVQPQEIKPNR